MNQAEINALMAERDAALDDAEAARLLWRQSEAACAKMRADRDAALKERDEALAVLRDLAWAWDANGVVHVNAFVDRARKLAKP